MSYELYIALTLMTVSSRNTVGQSAASRRSAEVRYAWADNTHDECGSAPHSFRAEYEGHHSLLVQI
jgi:hypothetical protein